jgi:predicted kinase
MIIIFRGQPGVGKSTIAGALADRLDAVLIAKDNINDIIFAKFGANKSASDLSYDVICYVVGLLHPSDQAIVIDCSLASRASYQQFVELAVRLNTELRVVHVTLDNPEEIERRLASRTGLPDHRVKSPNDIHKLQLSYDDFSIDGEIKIDGSNEVAKIVNEILAHFK